VPDLRKPPKLTLYVDGGFKAATPDGFAPRCSIKAPYLKT
jgi:hypothetical protein